MPNIDISQYQRQFMQMVHGDLSLDSLSQATRKGMHVYRNNLVATAKRSLSLSYPVITKMVGDDALTFLANKLLSISPLVFGDWAEWGADLDDLIERSPLHSSHPYLADMARLEWHTHVISKQANEQLDPDSLGLLQQSALDQVFFVLSPTLSVMVSDYPISRLRSIHRPLEPDYLPSHGELQLIADTAEQEWLAIVQRDSIPNIQRLTETEFEWLSDVISGKSIDALLDKYVEFDFAAWLQKAIHEGWVIGLALGKH